MSLRDFLWNYPENVKKLYFNMAPVSFILIFSLIFTFLFVNVINPQLTRYFSQTESDTYIEGEIGKVENLNPLYLTNNQVDRDIQSLIFTKFIDIDREGNPVPALAKSWSLKSDNLTYTFVINNGYYWSDGQAVTVDDVVFTYKYAIDLATTYSQDTFGQGMKNLKVEKINDHEVRFVLSQASATFFETISKYIVPEHIIENAGVGSYSLTHFSNYPIGSGPYAISSFSENEVVLTANEFARVSPNIQNFVFKVYPDNKSLELAFRTGILDGIGNNQFSNISYVNEYGHIYKAFAFDLPLRKKILFFNLRKKELANSALRKGITNLLNKQTLISVLSLDATVSTSSIPKTSWAYISNLPYITYSQNEAVTELGLAGYKKDAQTGFYTSVDGKILSLSLTYLKNDYNDKLVNAIKNLFEKEGIVITLIPNTYDQITQETLASRDFEMILYEVEVSIDPDQYNLWHSLKAEYPNLNISGYKFSRIDAYLERGRQQLKQADRYESYKSFQKALINDVPAIFVLEPKYFYVTLSKLKGFDGASVLYPQDRFRNIVNWSIE